MKKLEVNQMENLEGGKPFWGSVSIGQFGPCYHNISGQLVHLPFVQDYVFWIESGQPHITTNLDLAEPC